ncbi:MAG: hemin uptake protein HemP [Gammaproteobacteria bacterium]|nr:hemin uptake protein HemP [Gammaproteobacteria bacterium]
MTRHREKATTPRSTSRALDGLTPRRIRSSDLFGGATRVLIEHEGSAYQLQITSQGKLLLTK